MKFLILNKDLARENPLSELNDESIQLIVTSPPYFNALNYRLFIDSNRTANYKTNLRKNGNSIHLNFLKYLNKMDFIIKNLIRLLSPGGYIIFVVGDIFSNGIHLPLPFKFFNILSKYFIWRETIIWDKTNVINFKSKSSKRAKTYLNRPLSFNYYPNFSHEYILIFKKVGRNESDYILDELFNRNEFIRNYSRSIWRIETVPPSLLKEHPARFPLEIPNNLIKFYCNIGDVVFDPFAGFGTTLIEALRLRRIGIANDIEPVFCNLMENNIKKLKINQNYFSDQLNIHRIKEHVKKLRIGSQSVEEIHKILIDKNFKLKDIRCVLNNSKIQ